MGLSPGAKAALFARNFHVSPWIIQMSIITAVSNALEPCRDMDLVIVISIQLCHPYLFYIPSVTVKVKVLETQGLISVCANLHTVCIITLKCDIGNKTTCFYVL